MLPQKRSWKYGFLFKRNILTKQTFGDMYKLHLANA